MNRQSICPICSNTQVSVFLRREDVPIGQNLLLRTQKTAREVPHGNLIFAVCERCNFVFNMAFDPTLLIYGQNYDNAQYFSQAFDEYLSDLVDYLIKDRGIRNCRIVEVGCGNGYFLKRLVVRGNNIGIGYDPSYAGPLELLEGRLRFEQSYYGSEQAHRPADVVICRHVIEHVPDPLSLLNSVRYALNASPSAYVFFETPTVEWILRNQTFWDFFYEHCSLFTPQSLAVAFQQTGFKVEQVQTVFSSQYIWMEASVLPSSSVREEILFDVGDIPILAKQFSSVENDLKKNWQEWIKELNQRGQVALWGAGAKGATFANLVDKECQYIACIVDLNPHKQGRFLSGTGHPIVNYQSLSSYNIKTVIIMNPNYRAEISTLIGGLDIQLLDVNNKMEKHR